jgi:DNA-binding transcriptional LysR family regulator
MKFEYMKEFVSLSETRSYSICADILYISQPTLTRHIQELERELGAELFERTSRGIALTEAGELFLPYAQDALKLQSGYISAMEQYLKRRNGALSIATLHAIKQYNISPIIAAWSAENPSIKLRIVEGDPTDSLMWMRQGIVDYAFLREDVPGENSDFERIRITTDRLVCLVPMDHPLACAQSVSFTQLIHENIIYYENCPLLRNLFLGAGYMPQENLMGLRGSNAVNLVKQGVGLMLGFRAPIDDSELGGFSILEIEPPVRSEINFIYRPRGVSESGQKFISFVRNYIAAHPDTESFALP